MPDPSHDLPITRASPAWLAAALRESQATTLALVADYRAGQWIGPYLPIVNPPLWEVGHVAWFLERWVLRRQGAASFVEGADALYDSSRIAHVARWFLPLPDAAATLAYLARVSNAVLERLEAGRIATHEDCYYVELALYHQDMHNEALRYTRQTLGLADPLADGAPQAEGRSACAGDVRIPAGVLRLGSTRADGFVFDNEKWQHEVEVPAFAIARRAVSNGEFLAFVEDGGYRRREFWSDAAWVWRTAGQRRWPSYWRRADGWQERRFDRWQELDVDAPVMHVCAWEAEAWCRWAGRRLPGEAEWERAAATAPGAAAKRLRPWGEAPADASRANLGGAGPVAVDACAAGDSAWGCRQLLGNVWEWTASAFAPYPGYAPDPYEDYSRPWFGDHRVLRGGSFATSPRIARNAYRNFYTPDRCDVFAGFRTCAAE